ncbi:hypothetical protein EC9_20350 [Rosistilla ulvae]|uniref:Uncharacterized protein n=1 Tax=Rosistilla ulvae TaxID=1930277 RepID=A0A517LZ02_9BACT|nr:hypothetical protein [Rosistilla ulvae]QDS87852.1 hypothetical protein EC9_20350 [Rosistilla ulvae]
MVRAGLFGFIVVLATASGLQAQIAATGPGPSPIAYVLSEQVTCTCGQVNENYVGGPRGCSGCGQPLPEPPTGDGPDVASVSYQQTPGYAAPSYHEQPMHRGNAGNCCPQHSPSRCESLLNAFSNLSCLNSCGPVPALNIRQAPVMIGGGFGGSGRMNLQGTQTVRGTPMVATGNGVIPVDQADSSLLFDVAGNVANPDFVSVGRGTLGGDGRYTFEVEESIGGTNLGLPANTVFLNATATDQNGGMIVNGELWDIAVNGQQTFNIVIPDAANAGAAVVGRSKIATNNSPLPRTRVFFNYDYMDSVPLNNSGVAVSRFTPGFEYAMGTNQRASFEFRVPYASTLSSDIRAFGQTASGNIEVGDLFLAYKQILLQSTDWVVSGGVSVTLPSTNDLTIKLADGSTAVVVENQAVHLMPYLASIANLTERLFYQGFIQVDIDTTGNHVVTNGGLESRLRDTTRLYTDGGFGYFLRRRGEKKDAIFDAIIPTIEMHYERQLQRSSSLTDGVFVLGTPNADYQSNLNMVFGSTFEVCPNEAISIGYTVPIGDSSDKMFDGQLRAIWNRYF